MLVLRKEADMETLAMSDPERRRLEVLGRVRRGEVTLVKASELVGLGYRQMKRLWTRYRQGGGRGGVPRLRGGASNRRQAAGPGRGCALCPGDAAGFGAAMVTENVAQRH